MESTSCPPQRQRALNLAAATDPSLGVKGGKGVRDKSKGHDDMTKSKPNANFFTLIRLRSLVDLSPIHRKLDLGDQLGNKHHRPPIAAGTHQLPG